MFVHDDVKLILAAARKNPLLSAKEERAAAKNVFESRVDIWVHTLSYEALTEPLLTWCLPKISKLAERTQEKLDINATQVCKKAALELRRRGIKDNHKRFAEAVRPVAKNLSIIDAGLTVIESVRCEAESRKPFGAPTTPRKGKFTTYLQTFDAKMKEHRAFRDQFWNANIRLAISFTKKYDTGLLPFCDLAQEALLGLMTAVERFDYRRGLRFSTYATWWIRHAVNRYTSNYGRTIRWPAHAVIDLYKLKRAREQLQKRDEPVTVKALSKLSDVKERIVEKLLAESAVVGVSLERSISFLDSNETLKDYIVDENLGIPDEHPHLDPSFKKIRARIGRLPGIEGRILIKRFGLDGDDPWTLSELGEEHGLSRERIRQLQEQALVNLRGYILA